MVRTLGFILFVFLPLALAGCGGADQGNNLMSDAELGNAADPGITSALQDQIMVDPQLGRQANGDAIRPPNGPQSGGLPSDAVAANGSKVDTAGLLKTPAPVTGKPCPECTAARESVTLGGIASRQSNARIKGCAGALKYSAAWATRLPADLPLHPQARVTEAAGAEGRCALRVASFSTPQPIQAMLDYYYTKAVRAGYSAEHQLDGAQHVLGGTRARDDGAYVVFLTARRDGGTDLDLVANNGS
jgi:hypothetical protein